MAAKRVLWNGPLFGRLPKSGKSLLLERGWTQLENPAEETLYFAWPSKSGPQMETKQIHPALIRPYPTNVTNVLDDKLRLAQLIKDSGIGPDCMNSPLQAKDGMLYFVKHRHGAQGKSVYAYNKKELQSWWNRSKNHEDFVMQKEVPPSLDNEGRKFVLRSHILLVQTIESFTAYLHKDVICLTHASAYNSGEKSAQVSQAGKRHPTPVLLDQLESSHPAHGIYPAIRDCSQTLMRLARDSFLDLQLANDVMCFALLGSDLLVSSSGQVKICEVNSHPALGWGTMKSVSANVFTRLIQDMLKIVVFQESSQDTGFDPLEI